MEAFVAYNDDEQIPILYDTMESLSSIHGIEPVGIKAPEDKYELFRRITADNMANDKFYLLCDLGYVLPELDTETIQKRLAFAEQYGLIGIGISGEELKIPSGIRFCQKGIVEKWLPKRTPSYDQEHVDSVRLGGKGVKMWTDIVGRKLTVNA